MLSALSSLFSSRRSVFGAGFVIRLVLLTYGIYQDAYSALKYTDIDYYVFTDAARAVSRGASPYTRATYRYTPLLAWILVPTSWSEKDGLWFHSGKALFALSDLVAGWFILRLLQYQGMDKSRALKYASVWVLNPMVANISTRGSSEGLLCVIVMATLWAFETRRITLAGALLGFSVHFKIYPFIYGASMVWALESTTSTPRSSLLSQLKGFMNGQRLQLLLTSLTTFSVLNVLMYGIYGMPFLQHTFFHHLTRIDHRHNFSPYNTLLYISSVRLVGSGFSFERLAFIPQLLLSAVLLPITLSKKKNHFPTTLFAQTLAFVAFNKVCTSQYFLWYMIFLPLYLSRSSMMLNPTKGLTALALWVVGQAVWLAWGFRLEFLGISTFVPALWLASLGFFLINCWIIGVVAEDVVDAQNLVHPSNTGRIRENKKSK